MASPSVLAVLGRAVLATAVLAPAILATSGCYLQHGYPLGDDGGHDAGPELVSDAGHDSQVAVVEPDAGPEDARVILPDAGPGDAGEPIEVACETTHQVDLLVVLDDSGSLRPLDGLVRERLERIVRGMLNPPDLDRDGMRDWGRVEDVHLGVVTTSVAGPPFCAGSRDGALMRGESATFDHCDEGPYPAFVEHTAGDDPANTARELSCVAFGPRDGCTVEQPLEAMAKALLPSDAPFTFAAGEARGDTANAGFLRDDSVLVILMITDEDDCARQLPDSGFSPGSER